ncbi:hypothetical protein [Cohnella hashimotonis]|uniref:DUF4830 domain-containing protein n=1 Tax=Cohnella hashimotonis TaxID=2826895 RepID=A0ABT6TAX4_9BACL|nr:hypothetical protein [Cohnella hashimotonis]MDI4643805.1 hypothetical protein [Cohnella hashimotonis]
MKIIVLFAFFCLALLVGCDNETLEQNNVNPIAYINSFGWHVEGEMDKVMLETKNTDPSIAAIVNLKPYVNDEIYITTYLLREKHKSGKKLYAHIYQVNEKIIGGNGHIETWEPGVFSLRDKERLTSEGTIIE